MCPGDVNVTRATKALALAQLNECSDSRYTADNTESEQHLQRIEFFGMEIPGLHNRATSNLMRPSSWALHPRKLWSFLIKL